MQDNEQLRNLMSVIDHYTIAAAQRLGSADHVVPGQHAAGVDVGSGSVESRSRPPGPGCRGGRTRTSMRVRCWSRSGRCWPRRNIPVRSVRRRWRSSSKRPGQGRPARLRPRRHRQRREAVDRAGHKVHTRRPPNPHRPSGRCNRPRRHDPQRPAERGSPLLPSAVDPGRGLCRRLPAHRDRRCQTQDSAGSFGQTPGRFFRRSRQPDLRAAQPRCPRRCLRPATTGR